MAETAAAGAAVVATSQCKYVACTFDWRLRDLRHQARPDPRSQAYAVTSEPFPAGDRAGTVWLLTVSVSPTNLTVDFKLAESNADTVKIFYDFTVLIDGCDIASRTSGTVAQELKKEAVRTLDWTHPYKDLFSVIPFSLKCKITFLYQASTMDTSLAAADESMVEDMTLFQEDTELTDVVLVAGDKEVKAHRAILAARSKVFHAMFKDGTKEAQDRSISIQGVEADILEELVRYIYTGKVNCLPADALELMAAADMYALDALKARCAEAALASLSVESAAEALVMAAQHSVPALLDRAVFFVKANFSEFNASGGLDRLRGHPDILLRVCRAVGE